MEEIECLVCNNIQSMPSILPCCHKSVCNSHISEYCPFCKIPINPEEVIDNYLLISLLQTPEAVLCDRCEKNNSYCSCLDCRIILCEPCFSKVHKGKYASHKYSAHSRFIFEESYCKTHELPIEYFCTEEWKGICIGCFDMHADHPVLNIEQAATQTLFEVKNKRIRLQKMQEQIKYEMDELDITNNEIFRKYEDMIEITKDTFAQLRKLLDIKEAETCCNLESLKDKKLAEVAMVGSGLSKKWKRLKNVINMIDISKDLPKTVLMESMRYLTSLIQDSVSAYESTLSTFNTTFPYPDFKIMFQSFDLFSYNERSESPAKYRREERVTTGPIHRRSNVGSSSFSSRYTSPMPFRNSTPNLPTPEEVLEPRKFVTRLQSSNSIKLSWSHCEGTASYTLEYGIGSKTSGVEQFRKVYQGVSYNCLITDLLPKTTYRFRVCPIDEQNKQGQWSEIISVTTMDVQSLDENTFKNTATVVKRGDEKWIQFERAGLIQAAYPFTFGKYSWEVKVLNSPFNINEDSSGWIKIGVSSYKNKQIIGYSYCYSTLKSIRIFVFLDVDSQSLKVKTSENAESEVFGVPEGPLVPSFQYRPAKNARNNVKIIVKFDEKAVY